MTITDVYEDTSAMGCMGTNWNTIVKADDGRVDRVCGKWGRPGDKIAGCWTTGHYDYVQNGFKRTC